ncbi:hypothetical protein [Streptomyces marokkonensis]|uniref:hypothetical protein n=1 Tax=Streptomyces marokkonensis TaxID=324855 RepID=UPI00142EFD4C|nr:hypothetical protein [Streptomyces marokkonensis]
MDHYWRVVVISVVRSAAESLDGRASRRSRVRSVVGARWESGADAVRLPEAKAVGGVPAARIGAAPEGRRSSWSPPTAVS